jgi:predicted membrane protein
MEKRINRQPDSWKTILAIAIFALVITAIFDQPRAVEGAQEGSSSSTFRQIAFMSSTNRRSDSPTFRGGESTAVMGGADIDLRDAVMEGKQATLELSTVMGGTKIRVPESWTVVSKVDTVLGEVKNRARNPEVESHRLVLKGTVVMGELKITN